MHQNHHKLPILVITVSNLFYFSRRVAAINWLTEHECSRPLFVFTHWNASSTTTLCDFVRLCFVYGPSLTVDHCLKTRWHSPFAPLTFRNFLLPRAAPPCAPHQCFRPCSSSAWVFPRHLMAGYHIATSLSRACPTFHAASMIMTVATWTVNGFPPAKGDWHFWFACAILHGPATP